MYWSLPPLSIHFHVLLRDAATATLSFLSPLAVNLVSSFKMAMLVAVKLRRCGCTNPWRDLNFAFRAEEAEVLALLVFSHVTDYAPRIVDISRP